MMEQLVEQLLPITEDPGSNPADIRNIYIFTVYCGQYKKRPGMAHFIEACTILNQMVGYF